MPDPTPPDSVPLSRRSFLHGSCLMGAMLAVGAPLATALSACDSGPDDGGGGPPANGITISGNTVTLDLTKSGAVPLAAAGGFLHIRQANTVAVNVDGTEIRAFSSICPHEGNQVSRFENGRLVCPTHDSRFDTAGRRVSGPAIAGLDAFTVSRTGNTVTITKG
jgi:cytochrome b6-f complex iron-sulfur subunit